MPAVTQPSGRSTRQIFKVSGAPRIVVNNRAAGAIDISPASSEDEVALDLKLREVDYIEWNTFQNQDLVTVDCRLKHRVLELPVGFSIQGAKADIFIKAPKQATLNLSNRFGDITVLGIDGSDLNAQTQAGSIAIKNFSGNTRVSTKTGFLTLENVGGRVDARNIVGSINYSGNLIGRGDGSLTTRVGNIDAALTGELNLDIDAMCRVGHVTMDTLSVSSNFRSEKFTLGNRVRATLGTGGKRLYLETLTGAINIRNGGR